MIETKRLILRYWLKEDVKDLFEYAKNPKIGPMAGWKPHETIDDSKEIVDLFIKTKEYAIVLKENNKVIGSIGKHIKENGNCELGFALSEKYWGQGIMPEAAKAFIEELFEEYNVIFAGHFDFNNQSKRVIEKLGFEFSHKEDHTRKFDNAVLKRKVYKLTKEKFLSLKNPA